MLSLSSISKHPCSLFRLLSLPFSRTSLFFYLFCLHGHFPASLHFPVSGLSAIASRLISLSEAFLVGKKTEESERLKSQGGGDATLTGCRSMPDLPLTHPVLPLVTVRQDSLSRLYNG
ncbi:hypothetical protein BO79DRAFT_43592 [Aspergillus costaricaensis CBS 115574]|uniref:Uncharacterized protein n=1 Tax=Aspergillus costaricaensis CBS 115574 TaxID=1448317 RepID=A0ACD1ISU1_9EURO|nr:hypothetical protein BO79DRAFT_43592 [Aspergillus costaricaensis CBS 115574]RAK93171.1 hypothetical protein BO79DRAFT_43592 [Aspergillus costaricaensis CBS 115574]